MGTKEKLVICLAIKIVKKIGLLKALNAMAEKTENEIDDMIVGTLTTGINLVDQYYCQGKPIEELEIG